MASTETLLTQDLIRQGGAQTQVTYTKAEKDLLRNVKSRISTMGMTPWEDVDILSRVHELGSLATVDRIISEFLEAPDANAWKSTSGVPKSKPAKFSPSSATRGPRGPRTGGKSEVAKPNGTEGGEKSEQRRGGRYGERETQQNGNREDRRANGEYRGRKNDKGAANGDREAVKPKEEKAPKPVTPPVPQNTWVSIVKKNVPGLTVSEETIVISGKDAAAKEPTGKTGAKKTGKNAKSTAAVATEATSPAPTAEAVAEKAVDVIEPAVCEPVAAVVETHAVMNEAAPAITSTPAALAASEKKEDATLNAGGRRNQRAGRGRREKENVAAADAGTPAVATEVPVSQVNASVEVVSEMPAAVHAAQPKEKVILPAAFSGVASQPGRRGFSSSHVKVSAPAAVSAAPASVVEAPMMSAVAPVSVPVAPQVVSASQTANVTASVPHQATQANMAPPPALTSSLPHMPTGMPNAMPHGMFPNMNMHFPGQYFQPQEYFQPDMYSHPMMGYPAPFMAPPMNSAPMNSAPRAHDNKSPANTNPQSGAANGSGPSPLNSQAGGGMPHMYPQYLMNPMGYFPMPHFPMQSQVGPNANAASTGHYATQPAARGGYTAASRGPANPSAASYDQDESHFYNNRSYDAYSTAGYHPTSHHGQAQDQKPYGQDSSKSSYDGHSYDAFGHGGSFSH